MLQMLMQPRQVALHDEPQRFCVVFQPYDNLAVSFPAHDGSDGSVDAPSRKDEAGDVAAASMLTCSGAPEAAYLHCVDHLRHSFDVDSLRDDLMPDPCFFMSRMVGARRGSSGIAVKTTGSALHSTACGDGLAVIDPAGSACHGIGLPRAGMQSRSPAFTGISCSKVKRKKGQHLIGAGGIPKEMANASGL